jgi:hypothetical protein
MKTPKTHPSGASPDAVKRIAHNFGIALHDEAAREILEENSNIPLFDETETRQFERAVDYRVRQKLIGERDSLAIQKMIEQVCEEDSEQ